MTTASPIDPNRLLLTGENPYIRLSATDEGAVTSDASFWRILFSPGGPGHVLFLQSELTNNEARIYTDNIQMTRWLQGEIQGRINATFGDQTIPATEARFPQFRRPTLILDGVGQRPRRGNSPDVVRPRRGVYEPQLPRLQSGTTPRGVHGADSSQRRENHPQWDAGIWASLPSPARRS